MKRKIEIEFDWSLEDNGTYENIQNIKILENGNDITIYFDEKTLDNFFCDYKVKIPRNVADF